jgi:hypothetical protein
VTDLYPPVIVRSGIIRKLGDATTLKRGTILAKSSGTAGDGKLVILGTTAAANETLTPDCILTDDIDVGISADVTGTVYYGGCFDFAKCAVASGYTVTESDKDALREKGILFKNAADDV